MVDEERIELLNNHAKRLNIYNEPKQDATQALTRNLSFGYCFSTVLGCIFGSGMFITPALVAKRTPNKFIALCVWVAAGFISLLGSLCYCELTTLIKKTGSTYIFVHDTYGRYFSLPLLMSIITILIPFGFFTVLLSASIYACTPFFNNVHSEEFVWTTRLVAIIMLYIIAIVSCLGGKNSAKIQLGIFLMQVGSVIFLLIGAVYYIIKTGNTDNLTTEEFFNNTISGFETDLPDIGSAVFSALFTFDGWWVIAAFAEEIMNPKRNLKLLPFTAIPVATLLYSIVNISCFIILTHQEAGESEVIFTNAFKKIGLPYADYIIPLFVFMSCLSTTVGDFFHHSRFILSAVREGQLPKFLSLIHKKTSTPIPAVILISLFTTIATITGLDIEKALQAYNAALWIELICSFTTVIYLRVKKPSAVRMYKVWITTPIFMCLIACSLICILFYKLHWAGPTFLSIILLSCLLNRFYLDSNIQRNFDYINDWLAKRTNLIVNEFDEDGWNCKQTEA